MSKRLLFLTGTRADFGKLEPIAVACREAGFSISFFITGMHMMAAYGGTRNEVRKFGGADFHEYTNQRRGDGQDIVLSKTIIGLSDWVAENRPDLMVIHGDRIEALAGALVSAINYIRSAHIEGGEISGTIDEVYRHCNTKLCTAHFVSSEAAKKRVIALGERDDAVFAIGSPELDVHRQGGVVDIAEVRRHYEISFDDYGVVIFHPVTSELANFERQTADFFAALEASGRNFVIIKPNNDPGSEFILDRIGRLDPTRFRVIASMRFHYFSVLLQHSSGILGNSSAGVREAPFLGVPSLNVGTRQERRAHSPSIKSVQAGDQDAIAEFFAQSWGRRFEASQEFGQGRAAESFASILQSEAFWRLPLQKHFEDPIA
ncbi:MAG: UDP-N-acetylglucosamine 2-epimerase [Neomegalonema sp.]|nr:UDP-N-acetylglucosamine 2-epimerase [Neomegalonema sp.]